MWRHLIIFVVVFSVNGQLIDNQNGQAFTNKPFFNAKTVVPLKIKTIEGFYTYKKSGDPFKPSIDWFRYCFNQKGQIIEQLEVIQNGKQKDSTRHQYAYHANGKLSVHRYPAYGGAISEYYSYDSLSRLLSISYYRDQFKDDLVDSSNAALMRKETLVYSAKNSYDFTQLNQYELPFMDVSFNYNLDGYLLEKEQFFRMSQQSQKEIFNYNEKGLLIEKSILFNNLNTPSQTWNYTYDQWGNLLEILYTKDKQVLSELQIIYDYKTGYLGSIIYKDPKTNSLKILRFTKYTYYN
jgi:YD repeat-containing protein